MTDDQVEKINEIIKDCDFRVPSCGVCRLELLPCERVLDLGKCPEIIRYLKNENKQ